MLTAHAKQIPIFYGHGTSDSIVRFEVGVESANFLTEKLGILHAREGRPGLDFRSYEDMAHSTCPKELDDLHKWIKQVIPMESEEKHL